MTKRMTALVPKTSNWVFLLKKEAEIAPKLPNKKNLAQSSSPICQKNRGFSMIFSG